MLKHVCALGRIAALLIFTNWSCIFLYGRTASLPVQNRRNRHSNLCSLLLIWWVSYLETLSSCWSAAFTSRSFSMLVWVRGKILYTAWISTGLTPPQKDPIPSLNLVMNMETWHMNMNMNMNMAWKWIQSQTLTEEFSLCLRNFLHSSSFGV